MTWLSGCEAQKLLAKLFEDGKIEKDTAPKDIYNKHEIFKKYSLDIFRNHFTATKKLFQAKNGLYCMIYLHPSYFIL